MTVWAAWAFAHTVPVEVIFHPNWWFRQYGLRFEQEFYLDRETRIQNDLFMRRALYERFGFGEPNPRPRPIIGSMHVAGGFVMPALFGVPIRFSSGEAPLPSACDLPRESILALRLPNWRSIWPMSSLIADMDALEAEYGAVVGDFDTDGLLNTALLLRGQQLFVDFYEDPDLVHHLFAVLTETFIQIAAYLRLRTGSAAIATNRSILNVDPAIYLHSNCPVQMISPAVYEKFLLPYELRLAQSLRPYGIHHCGNNLHRYADVYGRVGPAFVDVGWGSDVRMVRQALPDAFLNLRLSPVRMLQEPAEVIRRDIVALLEAAGPLDKVGLCCINMDDGTPDENVRVLLDLRKAITSSGASE